MHTYEAWRISYQSSEAAARAAYQAWQQAIQCNSCNATKGGLHQIQEPATNTAKPELNAETQRNAAIGAAVMRACKELPEGAEIQIYLERGAGSVHMTDWDGNEFDHLDEDHEDFACRINAAIDGAIAAEKFAAQANQGGQANG